MSEKTIKPTGSPVPATPGKAIASLPRWKIGLLGFAGVLTVAGLVLSLVESGAEPATAPAGEVPGGASALMPGTEGPSGGPGGQPASEPPLWSPGMFRMGISFFLGFATGFVLRAFLKLVMLVVGAVFLILAGLEQADLITVNWQAIDAAWTGFTAHVGQDFDSFKTALTGRLPQAGLCALGIFAGFKKG